MIVYRQPSRTISLRPFLKTIARTANAVAAGARIDHAAAVRLLIDLGELEAAVADALFPAADGIDARLDAFGQAAIATGELLHASWRQHPPQRIARAGLAVASALRAVPVASLPETVRLPTSEGYAYYSLYPETYLAAAESFAAARPPSEAVCIGLRSIGTSLSAVVAATLRAAGWRVRRLTVRPRGHPFARRPMLTPSLVRALQAHTGAMFMIIDEGPGLSGSSFAGTAEVLEALGVGDERILLFPSWLARGHSFLCRRVSERWRRHRTVYCSFEEAWLARGLLGDDLCDISAGAWRARLYRGSTVQPAAHPHHERRKYLSTERDGSRVMLKFAGLGRYGEAKLARLQPLQEEGFVPPTSGLRHGFLVQSFIAGRPLSPRESSPALLATVCRYLERRYRSSEQQPLDFASICEMLLANVGEGLGDYWRDRLGDVQRFRPMLADVPAVAVDGRMLPHEWLQTADGFLKTDAADHCEDHFFPGFCDIAWDLAGFAAEFRLRRRVADDLAADLARRLGDRTLPQRLAFWHAAYLAARLGYCALAAHTLTYSADGPRFAGLIPAYARRLRQAIRLLA